MLALSISPLSAPQPTPPAPPPSADPHPASQQVSLLSLARSFLRLGSTTFGGMWAATGTIEAELVHRTRWLKTEDLQFMLLAASLIPAPKFLGLGGLVGYRLRGWPGSVVAVLCLMAPCALLVLSAVALVTPDLLAGPLAPLRRVEGIAVVGLLFGNAYQQLKVPRVAGRTRAIGVGLALLVAAATVAGIPLLVAAMIGFAAGAVLIKDSGARPSKRPTGTKGQGS